MRRLLVITLAAALVALGAVIVLQAKLAPPIGDPAGRGVDARARVDNPREVGRHCTVEAQERVVVGKRMPVLVSITEEEFSPGTEIVTGARTADGRLRLPIGAMQVVLMAPAFDIEEAMLPLIVPSEGDSMPALFQLVPRPIQKPSLETRLHVSLWRDGTRIASVFRRVTILRPDATGGQKPDPEPAARNTTAPIREVSRLPDLTLELWSDGGRLGKVNVTVASPYRQTPRHEVWTIESNLRDWLKARMTQAHAASRGVGVGARQASTPKPGSNEPAMATWVGLGRDIYRHLAPPAFQQMFWDIRDELGSDFRTIQIYTDLPWIPWELMIPSRSDGSGEHGFLGAELEMARWHLSERTALLKPPPQRPRMSGMLVIAPEYEGERRLAAQSDEVAGLRQFDGMREVPGRIDDLTQLLADLPQAIVHFAGHGLVQADRGIDSYSILLEDGRINLTTWMGLSPTRFETHPFFLFNSCDVGQSQRIADFVQGWAPAVLELGACGYIGALWPLEDDAASAFVVDFYSRLYSEGPLRGRVAAALLETRRSFLDQGHPIALAYVFYGDPHLTLRLGP